MGVVGLIKHYVEYLYPGIIISDSSVEQVGHREPTKIQLPKESFGFRFFDREETVIEGELLTGKKKNYSNWHYEGQVYTKEDVIEKVEKNEILLSNMKCNNYEHVVKTKFGNFVPLEKGDCVI